MDFLSLAKSIIRNNLYMNLATSNGSTPWAATVVYAVDEKFNFYFMSSINSRHASDIIKNPQVAITIVDYDPPNGLQIEGLASLVEESDYERVTDVFYLKKYPDRIPADIKKSKPAYLDPSQILASNRRMFKVEPVHCYVWDKDHWNAHRSDQRIEVILG